MPITSSTENLSVSVVVPVYNGMKTIAGTVEKLLRQSYKPIEIIVVDDGSTDGTLAALRRFEPKIKLIAKTNGGPASARNRGIDLAKGNVVAFTDSDCLPTENWLQCLIAGFTNESIAGVGGTITSAEKTLISEYIDLAGFLNPQADIKGNIPYLITANACFRKVVLSKVSGFSEEFRKPGGEEPELCWRIKKLGYQFSVAPDAIVYHHHRQTVLSFLKTMLAYGEGAFVLGRLVPQYMIDRPQRLLLQKFLSWRALFRSLRSHKRNTSFKHAICFSFLAYVKDVSFTVGYLRGMYRNG